MSIPSTAANNEWLRRIVYALYNSGVDGMAELQDDNTLLRQMLEGINYAGTQQSTIGNVIVNGSYVLTSPTAAQFYAANPPTDVAATWGSISGTLSAQADLQSALNLKANLISPSFTTPTLGVAVATTINGNAFTTGTGTLNLGSRTVNFSAANFAPSAFWSGLIDDASLLSSSVTFTQTGTGAVDRTELSKLSEVVSVKDFGAIGDNSNDDTAEIQACIDSQATTKKAIFFPAGTYKISAALNCGHNGQIFLGEGSLQSIINQVTLGEHGFTVPAAGLGAKNTKFYNLGVSGVGKATSTKYGIYIGTTPGVTYAGGFVRIDACRITGFFEGLHLAYSDDCTIINSEITSNAINIKTEGACNSLKVYNTACGSSLTGNVYLTGGDTILFQGGDCTDSPYGFRIATGLQTKLDGVRFEGFNGVCTTAVVDIEGGTVEVRSCRFLEASANGLWVPIRMTGANLLIDSCSWDHATVPLFRRLDNSGNTKCTIVNCGPVIGGTSGNLVEFYSSGSLLDTTGANSPFPAVYGSQDSVTSNTRTRGTFWQCYKDNPYGDTIKYCGKDKNGNSIVTDLLQSTARETFASATASNSMVTNRGYMATSASAQTFTLPSTAFLDDEIVVYGSGAGLFKIAQNASQLIYFGDQVTTTGTGGFLQSSVAKDWIRVKCIVANTTWRVIGGSSGFSTDTGATANKYGTKTNDDATAGYVGQIITSKVASGSAVSLTTNTGANVTSISLTVGDWDVEGNVSYSLTGATATAFSAGITSTSATVPTDGTECYSGVVTTALTAINGITMPMKRISLSATTTVYLVASSTFTLGTETAFGSITARLRR